jgi:hypothetical protein
VTKRRITKMVGHPVGVTEVRAKGPGSMSEYDGKIGAWLRDGRKGPKPERRIKREGK